ncbi:MAG: histidinol-phosphate transaminase [Planctomycetota bacterium]
MRYRPNISAMSGYQPGEQPQAGKFIKLNTNENPYPASDAVTHAIRTTAEAGLAKYPDPVATAFRRRAGEVLGVDPDWILCGNGSDDILTMLTRTFVGEGEKLRTMTPSYTLYKTLTDIQGGVCELIRFNDDWTLPAAVGENFDDVRIVMLANPNSPSGTTVAPEEILELSERLPCPLLVDEAYVDFADQHCLGLVEKSAKIMVSRSLSKSYALAGLRFGFVVAQPQVIAELMKVKDSYNCDALSIAAATAAINDQEWLFENRAKVIASRERFAAELAQLGFSVQPSQANFVWTTHSSGEHLRIYESLKSARILVRYMSYDGWGDGIRITIGTDSELDACLAQLKSIL